jgi:hypothetical protein
MNEGGSVPLEKPPPSGASADTRLKLTPGHSAGLLVLCPPCSWGSHTRASGIYRLAATTNETLSLHISQKQQELQAPHDAICSLEAERTLAA